MISFVIGCPRRIAGGDGCVAVSVNVQPSSAAEIGAASIGNLPAIDLDVTAGLNVDFRSAGEYRLRGILGDRSVPDLRPRSVHVQTAGIEIVDGFAAEPVRGRYRTRAIGPRRIKVRIAPRTAAHGAATPEVAATAKVTAAAKVAAGAEVTARAEVAAVAEVAAGAEVTAVAEITAAAKVTATAEVGGAAGEAAAPSVVAAAVIALGAMGLAEIAAVIGKMRFGGMLRRMTIRILMDRVHAHALSSIAVAT